MGNSIQKKVNSLKKKLTGNSNNQSSAIPFSMTCPSCNKLFPAQTSNDVVKNHISDCLKSSLKPQMKSESQGEESVDQQEEIYQEPMLPILANNLDNYFYEKLPADLTNTKFKWTKTEFKNIPQNVFNLNSHQAKSLSFQEKSAWFRYHLERFRISWMNGADFMQIQKTNVLMSSLIQAHKVNMYKQVKIQFLGDKVNDAGGLLREWIHMVIKEIFDESTGIFSICNSDDIMYKLKWDEDLDEEFSGQLLTLFGLILAKAIFEKIPILCYLDRTLLRQLSIKNQLKLEDIYGFDKELYQSWKFILENQIDEMGLETYFVMTKEKVKESTLNAIELVEGGKEILVTDANKRMYVDISMEMLCKEKLDSSLKSVRKGFNKIIPDHLIEVFQPYELQMLLYGVPFINLMDWVANTDYKGQYTAHHQVIRWFWEVVKQFDQEQLAKLLQFCTGSSRVPIHGFKKLESNRGNFGKFLIQSSQYSKKNPYPKGHTCFNRLELPKYSSKQLLKTYLTAIVNTNLDGVFGLD